MSANISKRSERPLRRLYESGPLSAMQREFDDLMENFLGGEFGNGQGTEIAPRIDVTETDEAIEVTTDLPGVKPEEINVELRDNCLVISAEHSEEKEEKTDKRFHRVERRRGRFSRSVWVPTPVDEGNVQAKLENGVLTVTLPKTAEAQSRRIEVSG